MKKRGILFGTYDTARRWTLAAYKLGEPEQQTNMVEVPGGIPLDLSTYLTEGDPAYSSRPLTARLECSDGTRMDREAWISEMVNALDGYTMPIVPPDRPTQYVIGRVHVVPDYNDLAHAAVDVSAVCEPWLYSDTERSYTLTATEAEQVVALTNKGRMAVVPSVTVTGEGAAVKLLCGSATYTVGAGTYQLPGIWLRHGDTLLTYSGTGTVAITYREAVLR